MFTVYFDLMRTMIFELHVCDVMMHRKIILTVSLTTFGGFILLVMCACTINELYKYGCKTVSLHQMVT